MTLPLILYLHLIGCLSFISQFETWPLCVHHIVTNVPLCVHHIKPREQEEALGTCRPCGMPLNFPDMKRHRSLETELSVYGLCNFTHNTPPKRLAYFLSPDLSRDNPPPPPPLIPRRLSSSCPAFLSFRNPYLCEIILQLAIPINRWRKVTSRLIYHRVLNNRRNLCYPDFCLSVSWRSAQ